VLQQKELLLSFKLFAHGKNKTKNKKKKNIFTNKKKRDMKKFEIEIDGDVQKFEVPSSWKDVTIGQFESLQLLKKLKLTELELLVKTVNILSLIDEEILWMMTPQQTVELTESMTFITTEMPSSDVKEEIEIDGRTFKFVADLNKLNNAEISILKDIIKDDIYSKSSSFMAILFKEKLEGEKLKSFRMSDLDEKVELMKKVVIEDCYGCFAFFLDGKNK
jgi:hypothetical protein